MCCIAVLGMTGLLCFARQTCRKLQPIITRDNVLIEVHPMLLYRLCDPVRVAYET